MAKTLKHKTILQKKNVIGFTEDKDTVKFFVTKKEDLKNLDPKDVVPKKVGSLFKKKKN